MPQSPPVVDSEADIFGLKLENPNHEFSVLTFRSKIISNYKCSALKLNKQEDPTSLCACFTSCRMPPNVHVVNKLIRIENISIKNVENNFFFNF